MQEIKYAAHINKETGKVQTVYEHSINTAYLSKKFSIEALKDIVYAIGLMHDIGKFQDKFQKRIKGESIKVEHSLCGAIEAKNIYKIPALFYMMQYCIAGHHSGLPDGGSSRDPANESTLAGRLKRKSEDYMVYKKEIELPPVEVDQFVHFLQKDCNDSKQCLERFAFITRYCFSCLTDADSLDTAEFCTGKITQELRSDFFDCLKKLDEKITSFQNVTPLQISRSVIQQQVYEKIDQEAEIFLMNMPTGSGKTLCSMKFALSRAIKFHKRRIIYVIPYNSIIDQTAELFDKIFGDSAEVLRHQSSFSYDDYDLDEDDRRVIKASEENWNAQIIITTSVQFFESIYANKRGKLRKLHNMADSIIVFDEAHLMPQKLLKPCLQAVIHITSILNSEAVFLTATMPDFRKFLNLYGFTSQRVIDLVQETPLFENFKKCSYQNIGMISEETLVNKVLQAPSTLVVVNTKAEAKKIYTMCKASGQIIYHLSTYMSAYDRKKTIEKIKDELNHLQEEYPDLQNVPSERKITVISTSLIEAGVDLDFFSVFREFAGLDNVLQAGGRCNREGKLKSAWVYVFAFEKSSHKVSLDERANILKGLFAEYDDISNRECIYEYYNRLFFSGVKRNSGEMISDTCETIASLEFATYAQNFEMINSDNISIIVERDGISKALIDEIKNTGYTNHRQLQKYACSVNRNEWEDLKSQGVIDNYDSDIWCLTNADYYDENTGITFEAKDYYV